MVRSPLFLMLGILVASLISCRAETASRPTAPYPAPQNLPGAPPYPAPQVQPAARPTALSIANLFQRAEAAYQSGNLDQAFADYTKIIELDPTSPHPYNNRGLAYEDLGEPARALADYSKAIELNPSFALPYYNRGLLYRDHGRKDQAATDLGKYLQLNPNVTNRAEIEEWLRELQGH